MGLKTLTNISKCFSHIGMFKGDDNPSIKEFLEGMNGVITDNCLKISEQLFKSILLSKISHSVRMALNESNYAVDKSCKSIYNSLLSIYDFSEPESIALVKLMKLRGGNGINNFSEYFDSAMRLTRLCGGSPSDKAKHFVVGLTNVLSDRLKEKLNDYILNYRRKSSGSYPPIEQILNVVSPYRDDLDSVINDQAKGGKSLVKFREIEAIDGKGPMHCSYCKMSNHEVETCFKRVKDMSQKQKPNAPPPICKSCGKSGHLTEKCRARCRMCFSPTHQAVNCTTYPGVLISQSKCEHCFKLVSLSLFHPMSMCVLQKN